MAPAGGVVTKAVELAEVTTAGVPLKLTVLTFGMTLKLVPLIVTLVPTGPRVGVKPVMVGAFGRTVVRPSIALTAQLAVGLMKIVYVPVT